MSAAWVVYVLVVGSLLALASTALAAALRQLGRATRFTHAAALAALLGLAVLSPRAPRVELRALASGAAPVPSHAPAATRTLRDRIEEAGAALANAVTVTSRAVERTVGPATLRISAIAWAAVSGVLLLTIALVNGRLIMASRGWPAHRLHGARVRIAPDAGPAVLGLTRGEIVVPRWLLDLPDEAQRLVVEHEREHLRARDHLLLGVAWIAVALVPWHPAVWYFANRIRLAIELDCDARVLRRGASPRSYGTLLIDMAARRSAVHFGAVALADGPSHLERRILAMQSKRGRRAVVRGAVLAAVAGVMVLAACEAKVPTSAEIASMDVAGAQRTAARAGLVRTPDAGTADFIVDGTPVSADSARALEGRHIASITVVKSERAQGRDTIYVETRDRVSRALQRKLKASGPDPFEKIERSASRSRTVADSTERMVAHVARELAASRRLEASAQPSRVRVGGRDEAAPTFLLDGRKVTSAAIAALPESQIRSVSVYKKDGSGIDPDAANGVIAVETRGAKKP